MIESKLPNEAAFQANIRARQQRAGVGRSFFFSSNIIALLALIILLAHITNQTFGLVIVSNTVDPATLSEKPLEELTEEELAHILVEQLGGRARVLLRDRLSQVPADQFTSAPVSQVLAGSVYPAEYAELTINDIPAEGQEKIFTDNFSQGELVDILTETVIKPTVVQSWNLIQSLTERASIEETATTDFPEGTLQFRNWLSADFVTSSVSSSATTAGLLTALLGSFWIITITAVVALIIGVSAAIYLEEYATDNAINRLIEINIRNLAAIPSVIYGMLGLFVLVFTFGPITSGMLFGVNLPSQSEENIQRAISSAVPIEKLTETDIQRLHDVFESYRQISISNVLTFGGPSIENTREAIAAAINTAALTPGEAEQLAENLRVYGSFPVNGRTVLSAGMTLALLILPIIIINAQEAVRAVPRSIREASYGLGATKWQTVSRSVLPAALPGILTGVILSVSRALGETAPLLVVGASTFIGINPNGPFSKFTVVPIQIYQWTSRPELEFRNVAAAAIIVLLTVMILLNGAAILLRNRYSVRY